LGLVGASAPGDELSFDAASMMSGGRVVRGIVAGDPDPLVFIPQLVALHAEGRFPFDRLIRFYPFEDINEALSGGEHGRTVKPYCGSAQFDAFRQMSACNSIAAGADALVIVTECLFLLRLIERPTAWLSISDSNFDVQRENSSL
jgi:hypothetical protein